MSDYKFNEAYLKSSIDILSKVSPRLIDSKVVSQNTKNVLAVLMKEGQRQIVDGIIKSPFEPIYATDKMLRGRCQLEYEDLKKVHRELEGYELVSIKRGAYGTNGKGSGKATTYKLNKENIKNPPTKPLEELKDFADMFNEGEDKVESVENQEVIVKKYEENLPF